jgi:catechol 2,3-dioxygenase-like lactoylglutathione lyase family enzyme
MDPAELDITRYVDSTEQLVVEIVVRDMRRSVDFYRQLGFGLLRDGGDFVELTWEDHRLFLAKGSAFPDVAPAALPAPPLFPLANVRIMVSDVDAYWRAATAIGARVVEPIGDRYYGLRDFIVADPDGFGVRFASARTSGQPSAPHGVNAEINEREKPADPAAG